MAVLAGQLADGPDALQDRRVSGLPVQAQVQDHDVAGHALQCQECLDRPVPPGQDEGQPLPVSMGSRYRGSSSIMT